MKFAHDEKRFDDSVAAEYLLLDILLIQRAVIVRKRHHAESFEEVCHKTA
ncbi:MAG: hypothetical protein NTZ32_16595 [Planctomycetales bacterium]|nr:hypothetical protein [Planctomycetales bacterium]